MSICVMVKVGEGLVLASDSASTISGTKITNDGKVTQQGVVKIFYNATKIFQINDFPLGILTWGAGSFVSRTIASLIEEFSNNIAERENEELNVENISKELWDFICTKSEKFFTDIPLEARPRTGFVVCGYTDGNFFPEEYQMIVPIKEPTRIRKDIDGEPDFGANWYGMTDAIVRFHYGRDEKFYETIEKNLEISKEKMQEFVNHSNKVFQYQLLFNAMPLNDAIEYAHFLVDLVINRFKFVIGPEMCGGDIDLAVITKAEGFRRYNFSEKKYIER